MRATLTNAERDAWNCLKRPIFRSWRAQKLSSSVMCPAHSASCCLTSAVACVVTITQAEGCLDESLAICDELDVIDPGNAEVEETRAHAEKLRKSFADEKNELEPVKDEDPEELEDPTVADTSDAPVGVERTGLLKDSICRARETEF